MSDKMVNMNKASFICSDRQQDWAEAIISMDKELVALKDPASKTFEEQIIYAVRQMEEGSPMKDFLEYQQIEEAISRLSDIYVLLGFDYQA